MLQDKKKKKNELKTFVCVFMKQASEKDDGGHL